MVTSFTSHQHKNKIISLPWWLSGEESPAIAGDMGLIPGPERAPCRRATEPVHNYCVVRLPAARAPQEKPSQWEAQAPQLENSPRSLQLKKAHTEMKIQQRQEIKLFLNYPSNYVFSFFLCTCLYGSAYGMLPFWNIFLWKFSPDKFLTLMTQFKGDPYITFIIS